MTVDQETEWAFGSELPNQTPVSYLREQILKAARYQASTDLVSALLPEDGAYTLDMVDQKIMDFRKGKVN